MTMFYSIISLYNIQFFFMDLQLSLLPLHSLSTRLKSRSDKNQKIPTTPQTASSQDKRRNWSVEENKGYVDFLKENLKSFQHERVRRERKIFLEMCYFLGCTKSPEQCRTHHQKALQKYGTLEKIISELVQKSEEKNLRKQSEQHQLVEKNENYEVYHSKSLGVKIRILDKAFCGW